MVLPEAPIADDPTPWTPNPFYLACLKGDFNKAAKTFNPSLLNEVDSDGNTPLHVACSNSDPDIVRLLFRYHANGTIINNQGYTAEELTNNDEIKKLFSLRMSESKKSESGHYVGGEVDLEWMDTYKNAYRIAYENREHMKRWLLKVSLEKLLEELFNGYIDQLQFTGSTAKDEIEGYRQVILDCDNPIGLLYLYTGSTGLHKILNKHLARIGSNFRFVSTQNLFNSGYLDNEAPKDLGQHIFAAILINHPIFQDPKYHYTGTAYRGMNITRHDLEQYAVDAVVLTRSFLSTSKSESVAKVFSANKNDEKQASTLTDDDIPVMCEYRILNPRSSLDIAQSSKFPEEEEVLIVPFVVLQVTKVEEQKNDKGDIVSIRIYLTERDSNAS